MPRVRAKGSSPHTRGARKTPASIRPSPGIIPAYAGSTSTTVTAEASRGDHPRIRGEHTSDSATETPSPGSSPHTRGAPFADRECGGDFGIIPAYAGSTCVGPPGVAGPGDHPRIRGEHRQPAERYGVPFGSSPHTRGAHMRYTFGHRTERIIPAYAGSTSSPQSTRPHRPDHPRIRGEHDQIRQRSDNVDGSSPHTRGARSAGASTSVAGGIIPAYAGSTCGSPPTGRPAGDHPRIRGEHVRPFCHCRVWRGSSPHTRGAPSSWPTPTPPTRIIPAYAGSTIRSMLPILLASDHPRIRGEHRTLSATVPARGGSSPHTRGALAEPARLCHRPRIIPAYAGSTFAPGTPTRPSSGSSPHTRGAPGVCPWPRKPTRDHPRIRGEH